MESKAAFVYRIITSDTREGVLIKIYFILNAEKLSDISFNLLLYSADFSESLANKKLSQKATALSIWN